MQARGTKCTESRLAPIGHEHQNFSSLFYLFNFWEFRLSFLFFLFSPFLFVFFIRLCYFYAFFFSSSPPICLILCLPVRSFFLSLLLPHLPLLRIILINIYLFIIISTYYLLSTYYFSYSTSSSSPASSSNLQESPLLKIKWMREDERKFLLRSVSDYHSYCLNRQWLLGEKFENFVNGTSYIPLNLCHYFS